MAVVPTKSNLLAAKRSLSLARVGYDLMDRKRNILIHEMMSMIDSAKEIQDQIDITFKVAYEALQAANITMGICDEIAKAVPVDDGINITFRSVMGVEVPRVASLDNFGEKFYYGFEHTNSVLDTAYLNFIKVKRFTVILSEIETSVYRLAIAIKKTQKRANALENVVIPNLLKTIKYISDSLEEKDREEFSRLKAIKKLNLEA